jgi:thiamine pyrophosphate-dependent acetolactate synthase large subunit-like protein
MMCIHELHTAVEEDLDVVVVVFNNGDYGTISKSPEIREYTEGNRFTWESPRFERIAEGFGCRATAVQSPSALRDAVRGALSRAEGPELVDVSIATDELSAKEAATYDSAVVPDS